MTDRPFSPVLVSRLRLGALVGCLALGASILLSATATAQTAVPPYAYDGARGPAKWSALDPAWRACAGRAQSPIALQREGTPALDLPDFVFDYGRLRGQFVHDGAALRFDAEPGNVMYSGNDALDLAAVHLRAPSEHVIDGRAMPLELQFEHRAPDGKTIIIAVFAQQGADSRALPVGDALRALLPTKKGERKPLPATVSFDAEAFYPQDRRSFRYDGSLTAPPCTEGASWVVMPDAIKLGAEQIDVLLDALAALPSAAADGAIKRGAQPANGRTVRFDSRAGRGEG
ncbi:MAG: carbonic anhydrase family protein [Acidobacteriota bacterium]